MRKLLVCLAVLLVPGLALAQDWRPFEIDITEGITNDTLREERQAAMQAERLAASEPDPEPESLGEAWSALMDSLIDVTGASVAFEPGVLRFVMEVRIFAFVSFTYVKASFDFVPSVRSANVIVLEAASGRERWGRNGQWEDMDTSGIAYYLRKMPEQLGANLGPNGTVTYERAEDGHGPRLVFDLSRMPDLQDTELQGIVMRQDEVTLQGRTLRKSFEIDVTAGMLREGMRGSTGIPELDALMGPGGWTDVGYANRGRLTFHGKTSVGWLPETAYEAVIRLERAGPHSIRFVLEDVKIGSDGVDGFLRGRVGRGVREWIMEKVYERFDAAQDGINAAYRRGEFDVRMTQESPSSRILHLRPGRAGDVTIRPGFEIQDLEVQRGRIRLTAGLERGLIYREEDLIEVDLIYDDEPAPPRRGMTGALGD